MFSNEQQIVASINNVYGALNAKLDHVLSSIRKLQDHVTRLTAMQLDACNLPDATGHLALRQRACLKLLIMIDDALRTAGIPYFLGYGNLLGAARTGKFIPWDDDVDICLMREDFNRAVTLLTEKFNHDEFFTSWGASGGIFKVLMTRRVCVDLFPWDTYYTTIDSADERKTFQDAYVNAMKIARNEEAKLIQTARMDNPDIELNNVPRPDYCAIRDDIIMQGNSPDYENGAIFEGIDWQTFPERQVGFFHSRPFRREWIFPLGEIEFCGHKFMAPNNIDAWLTTRFGDWGEFKPDFARHASPALFWDDLQTIKQFVGEE